MAGDNSSGGSPNKPGWRVIAKMTDSRTDRFSDVGVAWTKENDDGRQTISIKLNAFVDGARLVQAQGLLLVPYERDTAGGGGRGRRDDSEGDWGGEPPPDDRDAPPQRGGRR